MNSITFIDDDNELTIGHVSWNSTKWFIRLKSGDDVIYKKEFMPQHSVKVICNFLKVYLTKIELLSQYESDITRHSFRVYQAAK